MKEYKIAKGWAIIIYIFAPLMIALFVWVLLMPFQKEEISLDATWFLIPVSIAMIALSILGIVDAYKSRLLISDDSIKSINVFSNRELMLDEIKGYTVNEQYIFLKPKDQSKKIIKISKYIGGYGELSIWIQE